MADTAPSRPSPLILESKIVRGRTQCIDHGPLPRFWGILVMPYRSAVRSVLNPSD